MDELIKKLRQLAEEQFFDYERQPYLQAADAIEELSKPKWIPVTERLPDVFKHVLVNIPGMAPHPTVQEAFREKNGMWYSNGFRYLADEITHWMPLPEPPEEGK
jgi:hypothetical protein